MKPPVPRRHAFRSSPTAAGPGGPVARRSPPRDQAFDLRVRTQAPWDQLPIQVRFDASGPRLRAAVEALEGPIGDWYARGFDGALGDGDGRRFHYVSDPLVDPNPSALQTSLRFECSARNEGIP